MPARATLFFVLFGLPSMVLAQQARDRAVEITVTTDESPPSILLNWNASPVPETGTYIYRRLSTQSAWTLLAAPVGTSYSDEAVTIGVRYEYQVYREYADASYAPAYGYVAAGIRTPLVDARGTVLLLMESSHTAGLEPELAQFRSDLTGDGWKVISHTVEPSQTPSQIREHIRSLYFSPSMQLKAVILLGAIPVPYSGNIYPDGHVENRGAWPADTFYADMFGPWTDSVVNNSSAAQLRHRNVPGDGKFDQDSAQAQVAVGRIDFSGLTQSGTTCMDLMRNYLQRNHDFRHGLGNFATVPKRGLIDDNFGYLGGEAPGAIAWRAFSTMFGPSQVHALDWFGTLESESYLWAYGSGPGYYSSAIGIGSTEDFRNRSSRAVFTILFGSYFGDWDTAENLLRAPLIGPPGSLGLVSIWGNRPDWQVHGMAHGETIGDAYMYTVNNPGLFTSNLDPGYYTPYADTVHGVHIALMGDPTLRLHPLPAPSLASPPHRVSHSLEDSVTFSWNPLSNSNIIGYHVYRSYSAGGPYQRLTTAPVATSSYTDSTTSRDALFYQVRAISLTDSGSGSYYNAGQALHISVSSSPLHIWRSQYFTPGQLADPAFEHSLWGDYADPDADGYGNLLEYALGLHPLATQTECPILAHIGGENVEFSFFRARPELKYEVLGSSDLSVWEVLATNPGEVGERVLYSEQIGTRQFFRLRVSPMF